MPKVKENEFVFVVVGKNKDIKERTLPVDDFATAETTELFKKCGYKKAEGFAKRATWRNVKVKDGHGASVKLTVSCYGRVKGRAGNENAYDLPPPVDTTLFFGSLALVAFVETPAGGLAPVSMPTKLWDKVYETLFGGFEDLADTAAADEAEEDELESVPAEMKTKDGYLKDGFVVDEGDSVTSASATTSPSPSEPDTDTDTEDDYENVDDSELEYEEYTYSDDE